MSVTATDDPQPPSAIDHANALARLGFRVLPIQPGKKHPAMQSWQHAASSDPKAIHAWWNGLYRQHGVGIATGRLADGTQFFALDIDDNDRHRGSDTLHELEQRYGKLPDTVTSHTGSGGEHRLYLVPAGRTCPRNDQSGKLGDGLDIRGDGGQIVVAPTIHPNGRPYTWDVELAPGRHPIAEAPAWLLDLLEPDPVTPPPRDNFTRDAFTRANSPADRYNARTTWPDLLAADGWTLDRIAADGEQYWVRPGKDPREGASATVGWKGNDALKVFTSSHPHLQAEQTYSRFQYLAATRHGGDLSAAARAVIDDERRHTSQTAQQATQDERDAYDAELLALLIHWPDFWARDHSDAEWLLEPLLATGRAHAIFAPGGTGKSLLALWIAATLATGGKGLDGHPVTPRHVLYLDYEMTEDDLAERLEAMGFDAGTVLERLHYALLPALPPLDAAEGGKAVARLAELVDADHVFIDTYGRAVEGDENDADTTRAFYRWTGIHLKAAGRGFTRIDHAGKDVTKGQRGSSAKNDDVDIVWQMTATDDGFTLDARKRRMGWVPETVTIRQHDEPTLHYRTTTDAYPAGTSKVIDALDELCIGPEVSARRAAQALRDAGHTARNELVRAAQKARRRNTPTQFAPVDKSPKPRPNSRGAVTAEEVGARSGARSPKMAPDLHGRGVGRGGARPADASGARPPSLDGGATQREPLDDDPTGGLFD